MSTINHTGRSPTAAVCENLQLFGGAPELGETDTRVIWDDDEALAGIEQVVHILAQSITPDGTQLADERESLLWGFVNTLHAQTQRIDRAVDKIIPEMRDLERAQDGSEVSAQELETLTERAQNLGDRRDAFEKMRDLAADGYRVETGETWRPRSGSHTSRTSALTSAAIDARDFVRARKDKETRAHLPQGTLVAFAGGKDICDSDAIWKELDKAKAKYDDMVLLHGGGTGCGTHRRQVGGEPRRRPSDLQAQLEPPRQGSALPGKRRAAEPAAEGRHHLPRFGHHREPDRQGAPERYPRSPRRCVASTSPDPIRGWLPLRRGPAPFFVPSNQRRASRRGASRHRRSRCIMRRVNPVILN